MFPCRLLSLELKTLESENESLVNKVETLMKKNEDEIIKKDKGMDR